MTAALAKARRVGQFRAAARAEHRQPLRELMTAVAAERSARGRRRAALRALRNRARGLGRRSLRQEPTGLRERGPLHVVLVSKQFSDAEHLDGLTPCQRDPSAPGCGTSTTAFARLSGADAVMADRGSLFCRVE
jgi:hypothetical protein